MCHHGLLKIQTTKYILVNTEKEFCVLHKSCKCYFVISIQNNDNNNDDEQHHTIEDGFMLHQKKKNYIYFSIKNKYILFTKIFIICFSIHLYVYLVFTACP